jgi:hypothetical protein
MAASGNTKATRLVEELRAAYLRAAGRWTGCDWPTRFGGAGLNLEGLSARQATLLARATAGQESANWHAAAHWLGQMAEDAHEAQLTAEQAVELAEAGHLAAALTHARRVCALEATYRTPVVWRPLVDLLEAALVTDDPSPPTGASRGSEYQRPLRRAEPPPGHRELAQGSGAVAAQRSP